VTDSATLDGQVANFPASGTVTYKLFKGTCDAVGSQVGADDPVTVNAGTGAVPDSGSFGPLGAGPYVFEVTYGGDGNYSPISTPDCEPFSLAPVTPTLATTMVTPESTNLGNSWNDTATVTGVSTFAPDGSVRFRLCQETTAGTPCQGGSLVDATVSAPTQQTGNVSTYDLSPGDAFTPTTTGTYCYNVSYAAGNDPNYNAVGEQSDTECFTVTDPFFTITKTNVPGDGNPVTPGSTIPYTVTIANTGDGVGTAVVTDPIPSNLTVQGTPVCAVTNSGTDTCTITPPVSGTTWTFTVTLAAGDTAKVTFSAKVASADTADVVNTATITSGNPCGSSQAAVKSHLASDPCSSTVTNPVPDFTVTKTNTPGNNTTVAPGTVIPYSVAIKNVGDGSGSATVSDPLPSTLTVQGTPACAVTNSTKDTCSITAPTSGSTWTFAVTLAAGYTATVTFNAQLAASATGSVVNTATITTGPCNTSSGCASTVTNPIIVTAAATVTPTTTTTTTAPPPVTAPATIAFTGAYISGMVVGGLALLGLGGFLVVGSRRRRTKPKHAK
jgi:fimbrial isopeptide formation D2 family protein